MAARPRRQNSCLRATLQASFRAKIPKKSKRLLRANWDSNSSAKTKFALVVRGDGTTIRMAKVRDFTPAPYTILGWEMHDIEAVVRWLAKLRVTCDKDPFIQDRELGIWTTPNGDGVAWLKDRDGNVLSVGQPEQRETMLPGVGTLRQPSFKLGRSRPTRWPPPVLLAGDEPLTCTEHAKTKHSSLARESIASRPVRADGESAVNPPVGKIQVPNDLRTALKGAVLATSQWKAITPKARAQWVAWIASAKTGGNPDHSPKPARFTKADNVPQTDSGAELACERGGATSKNIGRRQN